MDVPVKVELKIEVSPSDACTETGDIRGEGPDGMLFEAKGVSFKPGMVLPPLVSDLKPTTRKVQALDFKVKWKAIGTSVPLSPSETSNTMYVTYGTPVNDPPFDNAVTRKRLEWAVDKCKNESEIDGIVLAAHKYINLHSPPKFKVDTNEWPDGTPPIWRMLDPAQTGGSCIAHSNLLKHIANILGVPDGSLERVFSSTDDSYDSQEFPTIAGRNATVVVVVDKHNGAYEWNYFEACLKINGKWYPGAFGDQRYSSPREVHRSYAKPPNRLVYITVDGGPRKFFDRDLTAYSDPLAIPYDKCIPVP
jgi:hypothetical protein